MEISIVHFIFMVGFFFFFSPTVFTNAGISSYLFATVSVGMVNLLTAPHLTHMIGKTEDMEYHVKYKFSMEFCSKSPKFCFLHQITGINVVFYGCFFFPTVFTNARISSDILVEMKQYYVLFVYCLRAFY